MSPDIPTLLDRHSLPNRAGLGCDMPPDWFQTGSGLSAIGPDWFQTGLGLDRFFVLFVILSRAVHISNLLFPSGLFPSFCFFRGLVPD